MRLSLFLLGLLALPAVAEELRVAVAANFKPTLETISKAFEQISEHRIVISSAATGTLHSQIRHGAPFDLFFAADLASAEGLQRSGHATPEGRFCYALGRLVLAGGNGALQQLADPQLSLAIANPKLAPYGRAAQQVLQRPQFEAGSQRLLARGNSVAQTFQFWHSGSVDLALLPASLAPDASPIPQGWHAPIEQHAVVLHRGKDKASLHAYLKWMGSDTVQQMISDAGYQSCH